MLIVIMVFLLTGLAVVTAVILTRMLKKSHSRSEIESLLRSRKYAEAENLVQSRMSKGMDGFLSRYYLAQAYEGQGKTDLAITFYEKAMLQVSPAVSTYAGDIQFRIAHLSYQNGRIDQALSYYELVLQKNPDNHEALYHIALICHDKKKYIKAKQLLERLLMTHPHDGRAKLLLARVLSQLNQFNAAEFYLHSLIEHPEQTEISLRLESELLLANNYYESKNFAQAAEIYDSLMQEARIRQDAETALNVMRNLLTCMIMKNEISAARNTYQSYSAGFNDQDRLEIQYAMAEALMKVGEFYQSIQTIEHIYQQNSAFRDCSVTVKRYKELLSAPGLANILTRNFKKAQQHSLQCLQMPPDTPVVYGNNCIQLFAKDVSVIINISPFPIYTHEAQQCKNQIQMHDAHRFPIEYYSFSPMNQEMRDVFRNLDYQEIFGNAFIRTFKG